MLREGRFGVDCSLTSWDEESGGERGERGEERRVEKLEDDYCRELETFYKREGGRGGG